MTFSAPYFGNRYIPDHIRLTGRSYGKPGQSGTSPDTGFSEVTALKNAGLLKRIQLSGMRHQTPVENASLRREFGSEAEIRRGLN